VHSAAVREAYISARFGISTLGSKVCLQVPLQRVAGAVGAEEVHRFSWLG
jgi:hypothetical protein